MGKMTKRQKLISDKVTPGKNYPIDEALGLLKELSVVKFAESIDVSINLGVDPRKSDQVVRSSTVLPNGTGKTVRVAVLHLVQTLMRQKTPALILSGWKIWRIALKPAIWILTWLLRHRMRCELWVH